MFKGSITALVTPFKNGAVDEEAVIALTERQIAAGTHGLVPCGTTGESATLTFAEHMRVVEIVADTAKGRVPVIAGTGSNNTAVAIENQQRALARLSVIVPLTIFFIFVLLYTAFNSVKFATLIIANVPFATIGGLVALFISGQYLSVPSAIGFIAVFGVALTIIFALMEED